MPLYEYKCPSCGTRFERIQKFSDPPETSCPKCHASAQRQLSPPAIQFKGSGWYVTDYGRGGQTRRNAGPHSGKSTAAEKSETAESKKESEESTAAKPPSDRSTTSE